MQHQTIALILAMCSIGHATTLVVLAGDPNCIPAEFEPPGWADPNLVVGSVLPASVGPNGVVDYNVPAGKFVRTGRYCDPDGDRCVIGVDTPGWSIAYDETSQVWTLAGNVMPGPNYVTCWITDIPPPEREPALTQIRTVCIWGRAQPNLAPILY